MLVIAEMIGILPENRVEAAIFLYTDASLMSTWT